MLNQPVPQGGPLRRGRSHPILRGSLFPVCVWSTLLLLTGGCGSETPAPVPPEQPTSVPESSAEANTPVPVQPPAEVANSFEEKSRVEQTPKPKLPPEPDTPPRVEPDPAKAPPGEMAEATILDDWAGCRSAVELRKHVAAGRVNATSAYLYQLADILGDPYCPDDAPAAFLSYRHFRQLNDRTQRIIALNRHYEKFDDIDRSVLARGAETAAHLKYIRDSFEHYQFSQEMLFWKGMTDFVTTDKTVAELAGQTAWGAIENREEFEDDMQERVEELQDRWTATLDQVARKDIRTPALTWAPLPPPEERQAWVPFPPDATREFSLGDDAGSAREARPVEFNGGSALFSGQLTCSSKQHVYRLENDDFRMMSMVVTKDAPILFSVYSVQLFSDFDPGRVYLTAMPNQDGVASFLLGPGTYYLRLLSWRDVVYSDEPLNYSITMYRGEKLRDHLTSGRVFVGFEESYGSIRPFRIEFKFAEGDRMTGRISWPTLLSETFFEGEYVETPQGTRLRFTETRIAKRSPFTGHKVATGGVYTIDPMVFDRRFVLQGEWNFGGRRGRIRCIAAGLHDISLNDPDRKQVISQLSKDYKHSGRIEQNNELLDAEFTLVYDEARGDTSGFIYWPRHPVKNRLRQYTDGVVIDTPQMLLLRLVDTRFTAAGLRKFPANTTTFFLTPKVGATGQGFVGRWRQGRGGTGIMDVTVE